MQVTKTPGDTIWILALAVFLTACSFWLSNVGLNLADEGYLWYGTLQTASGEVPLRDFKSYDPGRYYWGAAWGVLTGRGIVGLRISNAIFQAVGLFFALLTLRRVCDRAWMLVPSGLLLMAWMFPRHKLFESAISMAAVWFAVRLIEKPSIKRHMISGIFVGAAAFWGRNHGLYTLCAFALLMVFIQIKVERGPLFKRFGGFSAGVLIGYSPMLAMLALIPGFFDANLEAIYRILNHGTNLSLPVPWPWSIRHSGLSVLDQFTALMAGFLYLAIPLFCVVVGALAITANRCNVDQRKVVLAAGFVGAFYTHHAFDRADIAHLAQAVHPFLIGLMALPRALGQHEHPGFRKGMMLVMALVLSAGMVRSPYVRMLRAPAGTFVQHGVGSDTIWMTSYTAKLLDCVSHLVNDVLRRGDGILLAPNWPGMYAVLNKKSPMLENYFIYPASPERQLRMIQKLRQHRVSLVIVGDIATDGREALRFCNTHGILWRHLRATFRPKKVPCLPPNYVALTRYHDP
jgi:uncharacterized membrane protein YobD (UPF0266 family)